MSEERDLIRELPLPCGLVQRIISMLFKQPLDEEGEKHNFQKFIDGISSAEPNAAQTEGERPEHYTGHQKNIALHRVTHLSFHRHAHNLQITE